MDGQPIVVAAVAAAPAAPAGNARSRNWVITVNNPRERDLLAFLAWADPDAKQIRFAAGQLERGAEGTPHFQAVVQFNAQKSFSAAKRILGDGAHIEPMRGTIDQAIAYCTKEETRIAGPWTRGAQPISQGKRMDLAAACAQIHAGRNVAELAVDPEFSHLVAKFGKGLEVVEAARPAALRRGCAVFFVVGGTGLGKTHWINADFGGRYYGPNYGNGGVWWNGLRRNTKVVVLDEFRAQLPLQGLLRIADKFPVVVDGKHTERPAEWTFVIIASNSRPGDWYSGERRRPDGSIEQIRQAEFDALYSRLGTGPNPREFSYTLDCADLGVDTPDKFAAAWRAALVELRGRVGRDGTLGADLVPWPASWGPEPAPAAAGAAPVPDAVLADVIGLDAPPVGALVGAGAPDQGRADALAQPGGVDGQDHGVAGPGLPGGLPVVPDANAAGQVGQQQPGVKRKRARRMIVDD